MNSSTLYSLGSRVVVLLCSLGIVLVNTRYIGKEAQGTASLISFGILLIVSLSSFIGGGAVVFLHSRMQRGHTILPSITWAFISTVFFALVFLIFPIVPDEYILHACVLGLLQSVFIFFLQVLLGQSRTIVYNLIVAAQSIIQLASLSFFVFVMHNRTSQSFVTSLYVSFILTAILTLLANLKELRHATTSNYGSVTSEMFRYGKYAQGGNILHLLNQRLNLVFVENMMINGRAMTGILAIALYIAEAIWTVAKSLSVVQYASIANSSDEGEKISLTKRNIRLSFLFSLLSCAIIAVVPVNWYNWLFDQDMDALYMLLIAMLAGIVANSINIVISPYFSGNGLYKHNMWASASGLIILLISSPLLIPQFGLSGAGISISAAFVAQMIYFIIQFGKRKNAMK